MEHKPEVRPPVRKKFLIAGAEKELFMSFAIHQRMLAMCGGLEEVVQTFSNPITQMEILAILILGRECPVYKDVQDLYGLFDGLEISADEAEPILGWAQDFLIHFTFAQMQSLSDKYEKGAQAILESQKAKG